MNAPAISGASIRTNTMFNIGTTMQENPILVVDDDDAICAFVQEALEDEGYKVLTAVNGQEALDVLYRQPISFILLDMRMPVMNGWEFLSAYEQASIPHIPIVAMSAHAHSVEGATSDVVAFLPKPFDLHDLLELIQQYRKPTSIKV